MAIDTAEKRKSISGIPFLLPGVTPNSSKDQEWRQEVAYSYSGILAAAPSSLDWSWDLEAYISASWTSIAEDVLLRKQSVVATRGIDGSDVTSRVASPGSLSCLLDNGQSNSAGLLGYYSPDHTNMRANFGRDTLIRLKITYNGTPYYKWRGFIADLEPTPGQFLDRQTPLSATDFMQRMVEHKLQEIAVQENKRSDQVMDTILDNMAVAPVNVSLDTDKFTLPFALHSEQDERTTAMGATQKLCQTVLAYAYIRGDTTDGETFVFQREETRAATPVAATLDNTMSGLKLSRPTDNKHNHLVGQIHPARVDTDATTLLAYLDNEIPIAGGETFAITLRFRDPLNQASRISAKDVVTSLVGDLHYRMSAFAGGTGTDLTAHLTPTVVAGGNAVRIALTNGSGTRGFINQLNIYGKGIYLYAPVEIHVESGAADKQLNYDFFYLADPYRATTFLTHLHARASSETSNVENVWFYADTNATLMGYAMTLDIGDRVSLTENATGLVGEYIINKVTYTLTTTRGLRVDWELEPADTHSYFILDSSLLDDTDVLSPY
jgi:hypothetical protein